MSRREKEEEEEEEEGRRGKIGKKKEKGIRKVNYNGANKVKTTGWDSG